MESDAALDPRLTDPDVARHVAALLAGRPDTSSLTTAELQAIRQRAQKQRTPDDDEVVTTDIEVPGGDGDRPARWYLPTRGPVATTALFLHGGGWVLGDLESNDAMVRELTRLSGCAILSVDYRLAPEHPYPAALNDAHAALEWVATSAEHRNRDRLVVVGHSAGGNLAAALTLRSVSGAGPRVDAQVLLCPVLDHDVDRESYRRFGDKLLLTRAEMIWYWDLYHEEVRGRSQPELSPLRSSSFLGLPPTTLVIGGADPLRDEALEYSRRVTDAGVPIETLCIDGVPHLFLTFPPMPARDRGLRFAAAGIAGVPPSPA